MKIIEIQKWDSVSPDSIKIAELGINCECQSNDAIPFAYCERLKKFGINPLFVGARGMYHTSLQRTLFNDFSERDDFSFYFDKRFDFLGRIWLNENFITIWRNKNSETDIKNVIRYVVDNIARDNFYYADESDNREIGRNSILNDFNRNKLVFAWEEFNEETDEDYAYLCPIDEYLKSNIDAKIDDEQAKLFHLMTPQEKAQALKNNDRLRKEREYYNKEGDRAWIRKKGNIDPAKYHLLMYQENKIKLTQNDILKMVNECVKKIKKGYKKL